MALRRDALAGAAEMILAVERIASQADRPATVATVGRILCEPNAANVIPGRVEFSIDVRDVVDEAIASAADAILQEIDIVACRRNVDCTIETTGSSPPRPMNPRMVQRLEELAQQAGLAACRMNSGALHDAAAMSAIAATGMIFVPSKGGLSHAPDEETDFADIEQGANLLLLAARDLIADVGPQ
jgi:hydantoinase/carbamoylase family amidase